MYMRFSFKNVPLNHPDVIGFVLGQQKMGICGAWHCSLATAVARSIFRRLQQLCQKPACNMAPHYILLSQPQQPGNLQSLLVRCSFYYPHFAMLSSMQIFVLSPWRVTHFELAFQ